MSSFIKHEEDCADDEGKSDEIVPAKLFAQVHYGKNGEHGEHDKRDDLLNCLQLRC